MNALEKPGPTKGFYEPMPILTPPTFPRPSVFPPEPQRLNNSRNRHNKPFNLHKILPPSLKILRRRFPNRNPLLRKAHPNRPPLPLQKNSLSRPLPPHNIIQRPQPYRLRHVTFYGLYDKGGRRFGYNRYKRGYGGSCEGGAY